MPLVKEIKIGRDMSDSTDDLPVSFVDAVKGLEKDPETDAIVIVNEELVDDVFAKVQGELVNGKQTGENVKEVSAT